MLTKKSYARITLALDIINKIKFGPFAGYHELGIIKHQINLFDTISISNSPKTQIICNHPKVPNDQTNLCWQVVDLLKKGFLINNNVKIKIVKKIPVEAGLAGGSSNAATTMLLLNKLWKLNLSPKKMVILSKKIGMDVAYYFLGKTCFDSETTGNLHKISTKLKLYFIILTPNFGVSTKDAYKNIDYQKIGKNINKTKNIQKGFLYGNRELVVENLHNDFEISVFQKYPNLQKIKKEMIQASCENAVMSGSGSTLVGIIKNHKHGEIIQKKLVQYNTIITKTL